MKHLLCALALASTPVVVELFTSQGCSSCPPADALLSRIAHDPSLEGKVIPLAFHVDYWNYLGWRDPFSSKEWSVRQMAYVRAMRLSSAYTPQVVVNGREQFVGSNASALYDAVRRALREEPVASVRAALSGDEVVITRDAKSANLEAIVLVVERRVTTHVARGENEGRNLVNERIVRQLVRARGDRARITPLKKNGEIVVLLQDPASLRIHAAATVR